MQPIVPAPSVVGRSISLSNVGPATTNSAVTVVDNMTKRAKRRRTPPDRTVTRRATASMRSKTAPREPVRKTTSRPAAESGQLPPATCFLPTTIKARLPVAARKASALLPRCGHTLVRRFTCEADVAWKTCSLINTNSANAMMETVAERDMSSLSTPG